MATSAKRGIDPAKVNRAAEAARAVQAKVDGGGETVRAFAAGGPRKMSLEAVTDEVSDDPWKTLVYGPHGVGKSTLLAHADDPIVIDVEKSTKRLRIKRFPYPETIQDVFDALEVLYSKESKYRTFGIDTLDATEALVHAKVCKDNSLTDIEQMNYQKGYVAAMSIWRDLARAIELVQERRGMNVMLLSHSMVAKAKNPSGSEWDKYDLKLWRGNNANAAAFWCEWADEVLFANYDDFGAEVKKKTKGVSTGKRFLYTRHNAAYEAKNRHSLPERMPLSYVDLAKAMTEYKPADPDDLIEAIAESREKLSDERKKDLDVAMEKAGRDPRELAEINEYLNAVLDGEAE